jgi:hypothetical protein
MDEGALPLDHQHVQHPALVPTACPTYAPAVNAVSDRNGRVAGIILFLHWNSERCLRRGSGRAICLFPAANAAGMGSQKWCCRQ